MITTLLEKQELFLWFAMISTHDLTVRYDQSEGSLLFSDGKVYRSHSIQVTLPDVTNSLDPLDEQRWLFDKLCARIDDHPELLDHFATKFMEKLHAQSRTSG